jgi:hypothetical protein
MEGTSRHSRRAQGLLELLDLDQANAERCAPAPPHEPAFMG